VAVAAGHPCPSHAALEERAPDVHLVQDLPVGVVQALLQHPWTVGVQQEGTPGIDSSDRHPESVAPPTGLHLPRGGSRRAPTRDAGRRIHLPGGQISREIYQEAFASALVGPGPFLVHRAWPVAGLTGHVDLRPGASIPIGAQIVALAQTGGVALCAHVVPGLVATRPVQLLWEAEPALSALRGGSGIPGDPQRLEAAVREGHQVLLQGPHPEGPRHIELGAATVRALGLHQEPLPVPRESRGQARGGKRYLVEVSEHGGSVRGLHGEVVVRASPRRGLRFMALPAHTCPNEFRHCRGGGRPSPLRGRRNEPRRLRSLSPQEQQCTPNEHEKHADGDDPGTRPEHGGEGTNTPGWKFSATRFGNSD
jgi:hypothetical protein